MSIFNAIIPLIGMAGFFFSQIMGIYVLNDANARAFKTDLGQILTGLFLIIFAPTALLVMVILFVRLVSE
jgi:hypothetical protein